MTFKRGIYNGGGYPKGVRRNPGGRHAQAIVLAARLIGLSWREIAGLAKCDQKCIRCYATGEKFPRPATMRRLSKYVAPIAGLA